MSSDDEFDPRHDPARDDDLTSALRMVDRRNRPGSNEISVLAARTAAALRDAARPTVTIETDGAMWWGLTSAARRILPMTASAAAAAVLFAFAMPMPSSDIASTDPTMIVYAGGTRGAEFTVDALLGLYDLAQGLQAPRGTP